MTGGDRFANIDFGWLAEGPASGTFPIPVGLQYLLAYSNLWSEFHDLCWDALKVMNENFDRIEMEWKHALRFLELNDWKFFREMPLEMKRRLSITRSALDEQLREWDLDTALKNFRHTLGNIWKGMGASDKPTPAAEAAQKRLELRLSAQRKADAGGTLTGGATEAELTRTSTESLHSWLAKLHLEKWHVSLVEGGCDHVIDLVSCLSEHPDHLDKLLKEIGMPPFKVTTLKAAIKRDARYKAGRVD